MKKKCSWNEIGYGCICFGRGKSILNIIFGFIYEFLSQCTSNILLNEDATADKV